MKTQSPKNRPGRPRRDAIDRFRTQAWFSHIQSIEGLSAYALEKKFEERQFRGDGALISRPKKWDRYRRGDSTPSRKQIEKVAGVHPYSVELIDHPVWSFMRHEPPNVKDMIDRIKSVSPALGKFCFELVSSFKDNPDGRNLTRSIDALWKTGSLDALMGLVGAYRVTVQHNRPDVALLFPRPILSLVLHHAAFGSFNYSGVSIFKYLADMVNEDEVLYGEIKPLSEEGFKHTVTRLQNLRSVIYSRYRFSQDLNEFINPLSFYLNELGIVSSYCCEFMSLVDISKVLRKPNLSDDESLVDILLPLMLPRKRKK